MVKAEWTSHDSEGRVPFYSEWTSLDGGGKCNSREGKCEFLRGVCQIYRRLGENAGPARPLPNPPPKRKAGKFEQSSHVTLKDN